MTDTTIKPPFIEIFKPANRDAEVKEYCDQDDYDEMLNAYARDRIDYDDFPAESCIEQMLYEGWEEDDDDITEARRLIDAGARRIVIINTSGFDEFFVDDAAPTRRETIERAMREKFGAQVWLLDQAAVEQELTEKYGTFSSREPQLRPKIREAAERLGWVEIDNQE